MAEGIEKRHAKDCASRGGGRCRCKGSFRATVYSPRDQKKIRKSFPTEAEARSWQADAKRAVDLGALRSPSRKTLADAAEAWLAGAERGDIRNRSGQEYKPATLRGYKQALDDFLLPVFGGRRFNSVTTADLQELVDQWQAEGKAASTIRNSIKPLQAIYRRARAREGLPVNPTHDLELPAPRPKEVEIVAPEEAALVLAALPSQDRGIWATALYAGLRYGELRGLRWSAVDFAQGVIRVTESWDAKEGSIDPKTRTSRRTVPMPGVLRDALMDQRLGADDPSSDDLVFGNEGRPFQAAVIYRRADRAWSNAGLGRLRLHQARHTYASFMIAAGVNAKALSAFMGHSSIKVTFDLYGHLMPGTEAEAAALLDTYLGAQVEAGVEAARAAETGTAVA
ncbi:MAG TPA: tyrosine-type recombinase/integrase [Solirubrobacterales bacterium]|nr:tyrosine-type recombinase/integrase [Solirubrobacterales bacterium]